MSRKRNTFSKAVKHLKSSKIEEKLQTLNEIPTMNTSSLYDVVPGALSRTEIDKDNPTVPDYTGIDWDVDGEDGRDTSGLFDAEGNSLFVTPPGDNSYILGPMASMFYNYSSSDWTMIGYIRESDRRFVNLGYLYENKTTGSEFSGRLEDWDGVNDFNSYGQLTLEQALWFRDTPKKGGTGSSGHESSDFRAFYPGPPSSTPDAFGRYYCTITGTPIATRDNTSTVSPIDMQSSDVLAAILDRQRRGKTLSKAERDFLRNRDRGWLGNAMGNIRNALSNSVPAFLGRAFRSLTDPFRYAGELMFQGNPAGRAAGLSNYWSPNPITAGGYTGKGGGFPGRGPTASGTITSAPRPVNTPRVSRSPLGQPQFKFPKGSGGVRGMVTQTADNAAVSALGRKAANTMGRKLGRAVPFVGAAIAVADATSRISNGDYGGAILSAASAIPGPLGWIALGTQMVTDGLGATGNRREEYIIETKTKDTFRDEFQQMGGFDIEPGDWGAAFLDELAKTNEIKDDEKAIIAAVFSGEDEGLMITDLQETLGKIMVRIANKEYKGKKPDVQETISEERKTNIFKNLKNPVVLPESKKKHKVKPGQRYKGKTNFQGMDKLIGDVKPQDPFKKERSAWSKDWQGYNAKLSQEKKNQVLELVGDGKHYFDYMLNDSKIKNAEEMEKFWGLHPELYSYVMGGKKYKATRKEQVRGDYLVFLTDENGEKISMLQSDISIKLAEEHEKEMLTEYNKTAEPTPFLKDPLMKKVAKRLKNEIDYPDKPSKKGYPDEPPPKQVDGWHPEYGKKYKYDKLDPVSAVMMKRAPTGDPEIDANVKKASMKPKVEKKTSNWREELEKENKLKNELSESDWTPVTSTIANRATQTFQHISGTTATFAGLGGVEVHPSSVTIYGDDVSTPSYSDLALAGYAKPLGMGRRDDYKNVNPKLDASQEFAQKVNADVMMNARVPSNFITDKVIDAIIDGSKKVSKELETFFRYLFNKGPKKIGNSYFDKTHLRNLFKGAQLTADGRITMKDYIIGSGQKLQYNPKTNKYSLKFNYDFDDNATEILKDPEKWNYKPGWNRLVMNLRLAFGGKYGLDGLGAPGRLIEIAKLFGGGKSVPGEISINADILQSINPTVIQDHIANITGVYPNSGEVWNPSMMGMPFGTGPVHNYYALTGQLPPGSVIQGSIPHNYGDHAEYDPAVIRAIDKAKGKAQQAPLPDDKTPLPNAPDKIDDPDTYDWRKDTVVRNKKKKT